MVIIQSVTVVFSFGAGIYYNKKISEKSVITSESCVIETDGHEEEEKRKYPENEMLIEEVAELVSMEANSCLNRGNFSYEELCAISTMEYVHSNISGYTKKYINECEDYNIFNGSITEKGLKYSFGYCGTKAMLMHDILSELGVRSRLIQFWKIGGISRSHAALEVFWDDKWHFFDPTIMAYFENDNIILSWNEINMLPANEAYSCMKLASSSFANRVDDFYKGDYNYIEQVAIVGVDENVEIACNINEINDLIGLPAYIGVGESINGEKCETKWKITELNEGTELDIVCSNDVCDSITVSNAEGESIECLLNDNKVFVIDLSDFSDINEICIEATNKDYRMASIDKIMLKKDEIVIRNIGK